LINEIDLFEIFEEGVRLELTKRIGYRFTRFQDVAFIQPDTLHE